MDKIGSLIVQMIVSGILLGGIYGVIAAGLSMIFGVMRVLNFAHGEYLMLAMFASFSLVANLGMDVYTTMIVVAILFLILGALTYLALFKPIMSASQTSQIFVTVGLSTVLQNLALMFFGADYNGLNIPIAFETLKVGDISISVVRLIAFLVAITLTVLLMLFMRHTYIGRAISAAAQDREAAKIVGINLDFVYALAVGLAIMIVGIAAVCILPIYGVYPTVGVSFQLLAFVIVIIGGLGSIPGSILGGVIIGLVEVFSGYFISIAFKEAIYFIIFIIVLWVKPAGLLGKRGFEEVGAK